MTTEIDDSDNWAAIRYIDQINKKVHYVRLNTVENFDIQRFREKSREKSQEGKVYNVTVDDDGMILDGPAQVLFIGESEAELRKVVENSTTRIEYFNMTRSFAEDLIDNRDNENTRKAEKKASDDIAAKVAAKKRKMRENFLQTRRENEMKNVPNSRSHGVQGVSPDQFSMADKLNIIAGSLSGPNGVPAQVPIETLLATIQGLQAIADRAEANNEATNAASHPNPGQANDPSAYIADGNLNSETSKKILVEALTSSPIIASCNLRVIPTAGTSRDSIDLDISSVDVAAQVQLPSTSRVESNDDNLTSSNGTEDLASTEDDSTSSTVNNGSSNTGSMQNSTPSIRVVRNLQEHFDHRSDSMFDPQRDRRITPSDESSDDDDPLSINSRILKKQKKRFYAKHPEADLKNCVYESRHAFGRIIKKQVGEQTVSYINLYYDQTMPLDSWNATKKAGSPGAFVRTMAQGFWTHEVIVYKTVDTVRSRPRKEGEEEIERIPVTPEKKACMFSKPITASHYMDYCLLRREYSN
ncbi:hypothetical protein QAD02_013628 [Eretmocerus hayati]|uniref:Uncharacterized protein n=1 Tax=Eretmocerus hayati TaxID=131215 RepID=A0ACC2P328_9HYME|nr:hypothetical protein QAD02_013628 [Eretmocerus hayati]